MHDYTHKRYTDFEDEKLNGNTSVGKGNMEVAENYAKDNINTGNEVEEEGAD